MGGKNTSQSKNYYGSVAGVVCQGQLDFVWGLLANNTLVWPTAHVWDSKNWAAGQQVVWTDGNAYIASQKTNIDPPAFPWTLRASAWAAGSYVAGSLVVYSGNIWKALVTTVTVPPAATTPGTAGTGPGFVAGEIVGDWQFSSRPATWTSSHIEWPANSIVAWEGRLYSTPALTTATPPAAPWVKWKVDRASSPNPLKMTVPHLGDVYLYWGTGTQTLDASGEAFLTAMGHPPYRHRGVLVLKDCLFGQDTITPPSLQLLGGRLPVQSIIVGAATDMDADWQVNPWCVLAEALTHPVIGLGCPASWFDAASWQAEADRCAANPGLYYISPLWTSQMKVRELVSDLLGYPDGFLFWSVVATLMAGHWPHGEAAPAFGATNTVNRDVMAPASEIAWDSNGWGGTANVVEVSYDDIQSAFKSRPASAPNLFNRTIVRRLLAEKVDRPFIVRRDQALAWASEMAKIEGDRAAKGSAKVRAERTAVAPGDLFLLTDDVLGTSSVMRCTRRTVAAAPEGTKTLEFETERGVSQVPYSPTHSALPPSPGAAPKPVTDFQFVQLPYQLGTGPNQVACLAGRTDAITSALQVWYQQVDADGPQLLGTQKSFAVAGKCGWTVHAITFAADVLAAVTQGNDYQLTVSGNALGWIFNVSVSFTPSGGAPTAAVEGADYVVNTDTGVITIVTGGAITTGSDVAVRYNDTIQLLTQAGTPAEDIEQISDSLTLDEVEDNTLLLFCFRADAPQRCEIMSVASVTAVGAGTYNLKVKRGAYGTVAGGGVLSQYGSPDWDAGDLMMVIPRAHIVPLSHGAFSALQEAGGVASFVLAPGTAWYQSEPSEVYDPAGSPDGYSTAAQYTFNNLWGPVATWVSLLKNGATIASFAGSFATTDELEFSFGLSSPQAALASATLVAYLGDFEMVLWSEVFPASATQKRTARFSLPSNGYWRMALNVRDQAGEFSSTPLAMPGATTEEYVLVGTLAPTPVLHAFYESGFAAIRFGVLPAGLTVHYQVQPLGTPAGGSWSTATWNGFGYYEGDLFTGTISLYAYTSQAGHADSDVVSWNLEVH